MKRTAYGLLLTALAATPLLAQQPAPLINPTADQPAETPAAPAAPETFTGPDGKQHAFPLKVYDETADPRATIRDGIAKAKAENKRVLAMWGENYCSFCLFLEHILRNDPNVSPLVKSDYVWIKIDLGKQFMKNQAIAESWNVTLWTPRTDGKSMGAPVLSIIDPEKGVTVGAFDPATGKHSGVLGGNDMVAKPMTIMRPFDEGVILDFLQANKPAPKVASSVLGDAQAQAKKEGKRVLALFTMSDSEASDAIAAWLAGPLVKESVAGALVPVQVDIERMTGGQAALKTAAGGKLMLPPLLVVLNDKNEPVDKPLMTALPRTDAEIDAFLSALSASTKVGDADKAVLRRTLVEAAAAKPAAKTEQ